MSDTPDGPTWWQAADGKWYPPEHHPDHRPAPVPVWARPGIRTALAIGAIVGLLGGVLLGLAGGEDDSDAPEPVAATGADDTDATPTPAATAAEAPTPEPAEPTPTVEAPTEVPDPTPVPEPTPTPEPTAVPLPPPANAIVLAADGLGVATFGDPAGRTIDLVTAEIGAPTLDTRWITLEHPNPVGGGFADDPDFPTISFVLNQYRQVCWGDLVMLCTVHGRSGDEPGVFFGWEQAHRSGRAFGSDAVDDPAMGATASGAAVGRPASLLGDDVTYAGSLEGRVLASGLYNGWIAGEWPADGGVPDVTQPVLCLRAGSPTMTPQVEPCLRPVIDTNPINRIARTVLRRAIRGEGPVFLAQRVPDGPTAEAGYVAFDNGPVASQLTSLASLDDDATIEAAPELVGAPDPSFGGSSCALPGDISVVCGYRIVSSGATVTVEIVVQSTGVVGVTISPGE